MEKRGPLTSRLELSIFGCRVPDGKYPILAVGFPTCRHCLKMDPPSTGWLVGVLIKCESAGLNTCKMRDQKMRECIAGVFVICGRKMRERGSQ